jgi:hypothetical protein
MKLGIGYWMVLFALSLVAAVPAIWWFWLRSIPEEQRSWRSTKVKEWVPVLILGILLLAHGAWWVAVDLADERRLRPPDPVTTLAEFAAVWSEPRHLPIVPHRRKAYVVWVGESKETGGSGPSAYVFDSRGLLLAWKCETGGEGPVEVFMSECYKYPRVTVEEAIRFTERNKTERVPIPG